MGTFNSASLLNDQLGRQWDAQEKAKHAAIGATQSLKDEAAANETLWTSMDKVINEEEAAINANYGLQRADLAVAESQGKVNLASEAQTAALKKYGPASDEATLANQNLTRAYIDQEEAYYKDAAAARKLQEDTDLVTLGHKDAGKEADVYLKKLEAEANSLAPSSPLRINLQAYIDKLRNEIPRDITTTVHLNAPTGRGDANRASGGPVAAGGIYTVGERGPETLVMGSSGGTVIPNGGGAGGVGDLGTVESLLRQAVAHLAEISGQPALSASAGARRQG